MFVATAAFADSVTINNPVSGENVPSGTVWVDATASATTAPIWVIQIYLDGTKATEKVVNNVSACAIDAGISVAAGSNHQLTVQILQNNGALLARSTLSFNAGTNAVTRDLLDDSTAGWQVCSGCGGGGGGNGVMSTVVSSPSEDGTAMHFTTIGESGIIGGYGTSYWWKTHSSPPAAKISYVRYEFDLYIPAAYVNTPQAIEFECQQRLNGNIFNFAWQAEYYGTTSNRWRTFDYANSAWQDSGLALTRFSGDTWHHVIAEFHIDNATNQIHHDGLTIDGTRLFPTSNFVHNPAGTTASAELTNAIQEDMNSSNTGYTLYTDHMKLTYTTY
jgi:hypothetical protein